MSLFHRQRQRTQTLRYVVVVTVLVRFVVVVVVVVVLNNSWLAGSVIGLVMGRRAVMRVVA